MRIVKEEPEITASEIKEHGTYIDDLSSLKDLNVVYGYLVNVTDDEEDATGVLIYIPAMSIELLLKGD